MESVFLSQVRISSSSLRISVDRESFAKSFIEWFREEYVWSSSIAFTFLKITGDHIGLIQIELILY